MPLPFISEWFLGKCLHPKQDHDPFSCLCRAKVHYEWTYAWNHQSQQLAYHATTQKRPFTNANTVICWSKRVAPKYN